MSKETYRLEYYFGTNYNIKQTMDKCPDSDFRGLQMGLWTSALMISNHLDFRAPFVNVHETYHPVQSPPLTNTV